MEQPDQRVDLNLSLSVYDDGWNFLGLCDYTHLRLSGTAGVHSGDLTSAPPPLGASEFVDLDPTALADLGARYLVPVVFSYNAARLTLWEIACRHAAARTEHITVRGRDGATWFYRLRENEDRTQFLTRLLTGVPDESAVIRDSDPSTAQPATELYLLVHADLPVPRGSTVYALYPGDLQPDAYHYLTATDLVSSLEPATT